LEHQTIPALTKISLEEFLTAFSHAHGLKFLGLTPLGKEPDFEKFEEWLAAGRHGKMEFLERNLHCRKDPTALLPGSKISAHFGLNYHQGDKLPRKGELPRVAQYARAPDYHKTLRAKLALAGDALNNHFGLVGKFRACADSAPLLERALAARAGTGFIGKNTCFIVPGTGSWLLLAELLLEIEVPIILAAPITRSERTEAGGCGTCKRCQIHCPTGALSEDYKLDARKCISYHTIENRELIPVEIWPQLSRYIFGCDICQLVCPYNREAKKNEDIPIRVSKDVDPFDLVTMDQDSYVQKFGGTPMTRAKISGLRRNGLISLIVRKDPRVDLAISLIDLSKDDLLRETLEQVPQYQKLLLLTP
jgi:epoxyqueuosine reductase